MRDMYGDEAFYADLSGPLAGIPPENRTPEDLYNKRLDICASCDKLYRGMCRACGCYVELRAAVKGQSCSYKKW